MKFNTKIRATGNKGFFTVTSKQNAKDVKDRPTRTNFKVECLLYGSCKGYNQSLINDFKDGKSVPVSLYGILTNDSEDLNSDNDSNVLLIKHIKRGFSIERNKVLLHGKVNNVQNGYYDNNCVWHFELNTQVNNSDNNGIIIYYPWASNSDYPYNSMNYLKDGNEYYLIGYLGNTEGTKDVLNTVYAFNRKDNRKNTVESPCPFLFSYEDSSNENNVTKYIRSDIKNYFANNYDITQFIYKFYQNLVSINNLFRNVIKTPKSKALFNLANLKDFDNLLKKDNVYYRPKDIINFFTAMKSRGLTILAGLSGTGKTQLVNLFAESLGISLDSNQFLHISVKPSWKDDSSLIGFLYPIKSSDKNKDYRYIPDNSGLIDTLIEADRPENRDKTYIILLDEMNLTRVEYYFSQFLSELERPTKDRYIILYDKNDMNECVNAKQYKYRVHVGNNVHFVGTINTDESTYKISDKVLDRSNFITLPTFSTVLSCDDFVKTFSKWEQLEHMEGLKTDDLKILYTISKYLNNLSNQLGVSWRVVKGINEYLYNLPKFNQLEKQLPQYASEYKNSSDYIRCGFDYQIVQRILCKISGTPNILLRVFSVPNDKNHSSKDDSKLYRLMSDKHLSISCKFITKKYLRLSDEYYDI